MFMKMSLKAQIHAEEEFLPTLLSARQYYNSIVINYNIADNEQHYIISLKLYNYGEMK